MTTTTAGQQPAESADSTGARSTGSDSTGSDSTGSDSTSPLWRFARQPLNGCTICGMPTDGHDGPDKDQAFVHDYVAPAYDMRVARLRARRQAARLASSNVFPPGPSEADI